MTSAITALSAADQALREAFAALGDEDVEAETHHHMAAARKSVDRARVLLERRERLRQHQEAANVRRIR